MTNAVKWAAIIGATLVTLASAAAARADGALDLIAPAVLTFLS